MFSSSGILKYGENKLILSVDPDLVNYYKKLIPSWLAKPNPQLYPAHISVIRNEIPCMDFWGKHEGKEIKFYYSNIISWSVNYWWLNAFSKDLENIREELRLSKFTKFKDNLPLNSEFTWIFHITLGNTKPIGSKSV